VGDAQVLPYLIEQPPVDAVLVSVHRRLRFDRHEKYAFHAQSHPQTGEGN
jgi:hypothetical protein